MRFRMRAAGLLPSLLTSAAYLGCVNCFVAYNTSSSRQNGVLNVHIVPHTHDDSGWLKTVEQYYYGSSQDIQLAGVQYVLDTVIAALAANPDRKFSYAEMSFFSMWWSEQSVSTRKLVRQLVKAGQLDFINGGYVQNDEAAAHFVAMIDQTTVGHQFLNDTFGVTPRVGWQIDPFGHSATQASLMSGALGFDAVYFGRADYQDMNQRIQTKELEMLWRGAKSFGSSADVFTGNFGSGNYGPPTGFNWEWGSTDEPFKDHSGWEENNVAQLVQHFVAQCTKIAASTRGNDIMLTMGTDFTYANAFVWYKNLDKLIHYANLDGRLNAFYSTPSAYTDAKNSYQAAWPVKTDDFFPYADCMTCYWTGYFTSRPTSKGYIRSSTSFLQAARQVELLGPSPLSSPTSSASGWVDGLDGSPNKALELAVALTQHHDAITGTEKQAVADDYHRRLYAGMEEASAAFTSSLASMVYGAASAAPSIFQAFFIRSKQLQTTAASPTAAPAGAAAAPALGLCPLLNASVCHPTVEMSNLGHSIMVVAYNPLGWPRKEGVRVPLNTTSYASWTVTGPDGEAVAAQLLPVSNSTASLQAAMLAADILADLSAAATHELAFVAPVPALGYATFTVAPAPPGGVDSAATTAPATQRAWLGGRRASDNVTEPQAVVALSNGLIQVNVSTGTGRLLSLADITSGLTTPLTTEVIWYNSSDEYGPPPRLYPAPASGAYIFRPYSSVGIASPVLIEVLEGPVLTEIRQVFLPWVTLTTRLWAGAKHMEVEWTAGPIPYEDGLGREVVVKYTSGLASGGTFFTDANGREMQRRERDARPTWALQVHEPVAGNYYPLTSAMYIEGSDREQLALVTDRAQGGSSLASGEMEVMVHRRTMRDDQRGVGEPISETMCGCLTEACTCDGLIARGTHHLAFQGLTTAASYRRVLAQRVNDPLILAFGKAPKSFSTAAGGTAGGSAGGTASPLVQAAAAGQLGAAAGQPAGGSRSFLADPDGLPGSVQLVTLKDNGDGRVLLRLAHVYQVDEYSNDAHPVSLDLNKMFSGLSFDGVEEVALGAGQKYSQINRLKWQAGEHMSTRDANATLVAFAQRTALSCPAGCRGNAMTIDLQPMEIRTFLLVPVFGLQWKT